MAEMQPTMAILERIKKNSKENKDEVFTRLYRYMLRPDLYYIAYKKGKELWEQVMIAKRRKTIVLCKKCHYAIHNRILQKLSCNGEPCTSRDVSTVLGGDCANLSPKGGKAVLSYSTSSAKL